MRIVASTLDYIAGYVKKERPEAVPPSVEAKCCADIQIDIAKHCLENGYSIQAGKYVLCKRSAEEHREVCIFARRESFQNTESKNIFYLCYNSYVKDNVSPSS